MSDIVNKLWGFCHTLRHDGVDYGDYIEQLTYLLFLKMADERNVRVPQGYDWESLKDVRGEQLIYHYSQVLDNLSRQDGILGKIFTQAMPRISNPLNLERLIRLIDEIDWSGLDVDVKGQAFEGLLERSASEGKKGAGQYFTPRELIRSIVRVMKPDARVGDDFKINDPACGTGGFLVAAYEWLLEESHGKGLTQKIFEDTYYGQDLVARPARLAMMNLYLHGVKANIAIGDTIYDRLADVRFDCVLGNPPFGTLGANQAPLRPDFFVRTTSKQLNFVQHVLSSLKDGGRAALVLPDNCLFDGEAAEVFKHLMQICNLHTILRLPRGTFSPYAQGVMANVVFFQKGVPTENVWIYDLRSNIPTVTKKDRPLTAGFFTDFEQCYGDDPNGMLKRKAGGIADRFRSFSIDEIALRNYSLDITWLKEQDVSDIEMSLAPQELAIEAITQLESAVNDIRAIMHLFDDNE